MCGLWGCLSVVLLLDEMKRRDEKKKKGEATKAETGRGRRELTGFFREKKDILLDLMDGMVGGVGQREERERKERTGRAAIRQSFEAKLSVLHSHD